MEASLKPDGFNLLNATRAAAWQTVFHFHIHVIPRYEDDPLKLPWIPRGADMDEISAIADNQSGRASDRGSRTRRRSASSTRATSPS